MTEPTGTGNGDFIRITNREIYDGLSALKEEVRDMRTLVQNVLSENVELRARVRSLELKSYAIMAGLLGAVAVLMKVSGLPT